MQMQTPLVIIPTYDEVEQVGPISAAVFDALPQAHLLFVDDASPDGTGERIEALRRDEPRLHVLHRKAKDGLGRAYIAGFKWALEREYDCVFEMDADFSHDPKMLPTFIEAIEHADLVLGSRYVDGIRVINWPLRRLMLSKGAATYVRWITGMPVSDPTGGFKCFRREVLAAIDLDRIVSNGYGFQVEMTHTAWMQGFCIREVPIIFEDRRSGYSKMSGAIAREALFLVWKLAIRNGFRRQPPPRPEMPPKSQSGSPS